MRRTITGAGVLLVALFVPAAALHAQGILTVARAGNGTGTVTSAPGWINCGSDCVQAFPFLWFAPRVQLAATPAPGSRFTGWGGACSGTGACNVSVRGRVAVTAAFALDPLLTVRVSGPGTVTSTPPGIACGTDCSEGYSGSGQVARVGLVATPTPGYSFTGWSGACSGTGACSVSVGGQDTVTATFGLPTLTVSVTGAPGAVASLPGGIWCNRSASAVTGRCSAQLTPGTVVRLQAYGISTLFSGWSGACSGTGTACSVTVNGNVSVGAAFRRPPPRPGT